MTDVEKQTPIMELLEGADMETIGRKISGVLEFLTMRAVDGGPFYITTDDKRAVTVFAVDGDADALLLMLPENFKSWEEEIAPIIEEEVITNRDLGDEQDDSAE